MGGLTRVSALRSSRQLPEKYEGGQYFCFKATAELCCPFQSGQSHIPTGTLLMPCFKSLYYVPKIWLRCSCLCVDEGPTMEVPLLCNCLLCVVWLRSTFFRGTTKSTSQLTREGQTSVTEAMISHLGQLSFYQPLDQAKPQALRIVLSSP